MSPPEPVVSVVMSVFNGERFVHEAVSSILAQRIGALELVVIDDGSNDRTPEILEAIVDSRLRFVRRSHAGLSAALNTGIALARAPLIARMDADDVADPRRLERQVAYLEAHPDVGLLGTAVRLTDYSGSDLGVWRPSSADADIRRRMIRSNQFAHPTVIFRKSLFESIGGYREDMPLAEDYDLWLRILTQCRGANLCDPLLLRRLGPGQFGTASETRQIRSALRAHLRALRRGDFPLHDATKLMRPLVAAAMPGPLRQFLRRFVPGTAQAATRWNSVDPPAD
jgi:glycosyltransferase involved in cell wall biosynthesis